MPDLYRGIVRELNASHYGHYSSPPSRRGNRRVYPAKTSLWAKVEIEGGRKVDVWITKTEGQSGVPVNEQIQQLEAKYADLVDAAILFERGYRSTTYFYKGRVPVSSATSPDPV